MAWPACSCKAARSRNFRSRPIPRKLLAAERHGHGYSRRRAPHQPDRFARPAQQDHQLYLALVNGQVHDPGADRRRSSSRRRQPAFPCASAMSPTVAPGVKPVYTIVTANGKPAVLLNINRQPDSNTVAVANEVHAEIDRIRQIASARHSARTVLRSVGDRHASPSRACATPSSSALILASHHHGAVPARLGHFVGGRRWSFPSPCW